MESGYVFKWENAFQDNMLCSLYDMQVAEELVDLTLTCDGASLRVHKILLAAWSPYIKHLLVGNPCNHPVVFLKDVSFSDLELLITFIYNGEVTVDILQMESFINTAKNLQIRGLSESTTKQCMTTAMEPDSSESNSAKCETRTIPLRNHKQSNKHSDHKLQQPNKREHRVEQCSELNKRVKLELEEVVGIKTELEDNDEGTAEDNFSSVSVSSELPSLSVSSELPSVSLPSVPVSSGLPAISVRSGLSIPDYDSQQLCELMRTDSINTCQAIPDNSYTVSGYPCPFCEKSYANWGFRRRHLKAIHSNTELCCRMCVIKLQNKEEWCLHMVGAHSLSCEAAKQGIMILDEALTVLQNPHPMRLVDVTKLVSSLQHKDKE